MARSNPVRRIAGLPPLLSRVIRAVAHESGDRAAALSDLARLYMMIVPLRGVAPSDEVRDAIERIAERHLRRGDADAELQRAMKRVPDLKERDAIENACVQLLEYSEAAFSFSGNIYGATFFMATGFHGFHVFIGTIFLLVCLIRAYRGDFTPKQHLGFEFAAWYWHFVDVVWLFLFASIYVWGSWGATIAHH